MRRLKTLRERLEQLSREKNLVIEYSNAQGYLLVIYDPNVPNTVEHVSPHHGLSEFDSWAIKTGIPSYLYDFVNKHFSTGANRVLLVGADMITPVHVIDRVLRSSTQLFHVFQKSVDKQFFRELIELVADGSKGLSIQVHTRYRVSDNELEHS